ncbi:helix-turn-helix domain-containing protein [Arcicella lustrica]|uniref:Helix-turn-helix domain-containing protein n=1 Tax=Arcicella lustrica TaxID=2984196 RepID=A0ABU5SR79_9BACT|nr:helix-turn-helix domain-containing protein [Arcicella sp. DC25W]MEA5429677.1 helix-turn-helix domain-containing protein [Arcicella sp. DC25W]
MMEIIKPIKNEQDYELALKILTSIFHAKPNTPEGDALEVWSLLVHEYEQKHYKIQPLTALEALKYEMEEQGLTQTALAQRFGISKSTISEILSGKKQMSVNFLKFLHKDLGIPASALLG